MGSSSKLEKPLPRFLEDVAARTPAPGGGSVAAVAAAMGAALAEMAARFSDDDEAAGRAASLRGRLVTLAEEDAAAYAAVLAAKGPEREEALSRAANVPLAIARQLRRQASSARRSPSAVIRTCAATR